ncbi:MAG: trigger factor, partial [Bacteroidota bacterium]
MNITKNLVDELNAVIKINLSEEDYNPRVEKVIREYRQKTNMPGFRPGNVPVGLIKKLYGKHILVEEINKILSEELSKYIFDNKISILAEPLPSEKEQKELDWEKNTEFEFSYDIGLSPAFDINLSESIKVPYYIIDPDKEMINKQIEDYCYRLGSYVEIEQIEENVKLTGSFTELDENGAPAKNGLYTDEGSFLTQIIKIDDLKNSLIGMKVNDSIKINMVEAFPNQTELAAILKIDKKDINKLDPMFEFKISCISKWQASEVNQELFDKTYGENQIQSLKEFEKRIAEDMKNNLSKESNY